ncbi:hypothetical protein A9J40_01870 [Stenotrophomonas maltophilia]|nr:hypothetical protein A9J40_01870 [Stenotrophomonas maltophilia]
MVCANFRPLGNYSIQPDAMEQPVWHLSPLFKCHAEEYGDRSACLQRIRGIDRAATGQPHLISQDVSGNTEKEVTSAGGTGKNVQSVEV